MSERNPKIDIEVGDPCEISTTDYNTSIHVTMIGADLVLPDLAQL